MGALMLGVASRLRWPLAALVVRALTWLGTHTIYRVRVTGRENLPREGPALLVANHVCWVEGVLLLAVQRRPVRFLVDSGYVRSALLARLGRWLGVIPIPLDGNPRAVLAALKPAREALARGELVCVFAEGQMSQAGGPLPFRRGFRRITGGRDIPIVPVYLDLSWGGNFSFQGGRLRARLPRQIPYPVAVVFGRPLPAESSPWQVRQAVQEAGVRGVRMRKSSQMPLHRQFVRLAARHPFRPCMADTTGVEMRYGTALVRILVLARLLKRTLGREPMVGVLLPSIAGGAMANIALLLLGKVPVNLNFTSSRDSVESALRQCGIRQVLTSKLFLKRIDVELGAEYVYLDDLRHEVRTSDKLIGFASVWLLPGWVLEHWVLGLGQHRIDDLATVIFSSGSMGEPKGVMLSQHNLVSNVEAVVQLAKPGPKDVLVGTLPFFHSFGFTVTIWCPLLVGAKVVYHPSPLDAKEIGELCRKHGGTLFLTTPTFMRNYLKRCEPDDFRTVRLLLCGAEKLPQSLADAAEKKFGVRPLEGYGCTELSPVVSANVPDFEQDGVRQVCNIPGTVGHPLPGIAVRIVDPDTLAIRPPGQEGLLEVKGANVMVGYLAEPELTAAVIRNGWYSTGDVAKIDVHGFIRITDRLSRFSKVAGEMVPHLQVEQKLHEILGTDDLLCAVTGVPDPRKGERLIVLHTPLEIDRETLWHRLHDSGLPNLWVPARDAFYEVPEIPVLGSGKLDLRRLRQLAVQLSARTAVRR